MVIEYRLKGWICMHRRNKPKRERVLYVSFFRAEVSSVLRRPDNERRRDMCRLGGGGLAPVDPFGGVEFRQTRGKKKR